jgi:hypothetical protein
MPAPFVAVGDDGSIGLEWDQADNYLYLVFSDDDGEVYWRGANGEEWESHLDAAPDKLSNAIQELIVR